MRLMSIVLQCHRVLVASVPAYYPNPAIPPTYIPDEEALSSCRLENQLAALASWQLAAFRISNKITENKTKNTERNHAQAATRSSDTLRVHALCLTHT
jgi:hypothetical protein